MPQAFAHDERVAAKDDGDVMMPAWEGAAFEVIKAEFAFQLFVRALRAPTFLDDAYDLFLGHPARQRRQPATVALDPTDSDTIPPAGTETAGSLRGRRRSFSRPL